MTGAAAGVGLAVSRLLLEAGARVMMADPDDEKLEESFAEIEAEIDEWLNQQIENSRKAAN